MSEAYSIYEAKTHFSQLVRKIRQGEEIIIKERGTPVGKLIPFKKGESFKQRVRGLVSRGRISTAKKASIPGGIKRTGALKRFLEERE